MNPTSLNDPRIEKDYALLKAISESCIAVQPLIKNIAYLGAINSYGDSLIDENGQLTLEAHIIIETAVYTELTAYIADMKKVALKHVQSTDQMIVVITNFNVYQEEFDYEFNQLLAQIKAQN